MPVINRKTKRKNDRRDESSSNTTGRSYLEVIKGLEKEMGSMRGRDADVVMKECDEVMERLSKDVSVSKRERAHFEKRLKEVKAEASTESALEKGCAKWVTRIFMITTFLPLIITMMG